MHVHVGGGEKGGGDRLTCRGVIIFLALLSEGSLKSRRLGRFTVFLGGADETLPPHLSPPMCARFIDEGGGCNKLC